MTAVDLERDVIEPWLSERTSYVESDEGDSEKNEDIAAQTAGLMRGYVDHWGDELETYETLAVEPQVARWLVHPEHGGPIVDRPMVGGRRTQRRWSYGGAVDRIVRRRDDGSIWQIETKSMTGSFDGYCRKLHLDPQTRGYAFAQRDPVVEVTDRRVNRPLHVEGVVYNLIRKSVPTVPHLVAKCGRCGHPASKHTDGGCDGSAKCGCEGWAPSSLSVAHIDTTRDTFARSIIDNGLDPDDYADHLATLPGLEAFFHREEYAFTDREIDTFGVDVAHAALDLIEAGKAKYHTRQTAICNGFQRRGCPSGFESICLQNLDLPYSTLGFQQKTIRHVELTGDLAEPYFGKEVGPLDDNKEPILALAPSSDDDGSSEIFTKPVDENDSFDSFLNDD